MLCMIRRTEFFFSPSFTYSYVLVVIIPGYVLCMVFGIILVNNVSMVYWKHDTLLVCIHSRWYLRSVAQPSIILIGIERTSVRVQQYHM